jgi:Outer membrane lipoprotein-sorting protein
MVILTRLLALLAILIAPAVASQQPARGTETPRGLAEQIDKRDTGRDSRTDLTMRLFDRQGRVRERSLAITMLRGTAGQGDRVLIRFLAPNDIKGTGFLVWEHAKQEDERFLYLPALRRVRRIAGAETQESFVGSDLSYEDIGGRELDDYEYTFADRDASWTAPDGTVYSAWRLESRVLDSQAIYPRTVSLVRKDNFVVVAADLFNRRNEREKRYEVRRLQQIGRVWTAMEVVMANDLQRTRTELVVNEARYDIGLSDRDFTRRVLELGER